MSPNETTNQEAWGAYNELLIGPDIERLRKILVRAELFSRVLKVPGGMSGCKRCPGQERLQPTYSRKHINKTATE